MNPHFLAGCARMDRDTVDEKRHLDQATRLRARLKEILS